MRAQRALLGLGALCLALAGCSERPRLNPFDPHNVSTGGRPQGFQALAGSGLVQLTWLDVVAAGQTGYRIFRRQPPDTTFVDVFGLILPRVQSVTDFAVQNRTTYIYRIRYEFNSGLGAAYAEDIATPAPLQPLLLQVDPGAVLLLTADGRRTTSASGGLTSPNRIAVNTVTRHIWVANTFAGEVLVLDEAGDLLKRIGGFGSPTGIVVDLVDGSAWVCDEQLGSVRHLDENGLPVGINPVFGPLDTPTGIAIDGRTRDVWICENGGNRVFKLDRDGYPLLAVPLGVSDPTRAAVDSLTGEVWVTDFSGGRVYKISPTGSLIDTFGGVAGALGVAVDNRRGVIWVAAGRDNAVVALNRNGTTALRVTGIQGPRHLALDLEGGEAWVVDSGDELVRITSTGAVIMRRTIPSPIDIAGDPE